MNDVDVLMLTPMGAMHAFGDPEPDDEQQALSSLLNGRGARQRTEWVGPGRERRHLLERFIARGWVECIDRRTEAPAEVLDDLLPTLIAGLSSTRCAALASDSGLRVAANGYSAEEAERLCVAAADLSAFVARQSERCWPGRLRSVSFHEDLQVGLPVHSFVRFWVDGTAYWLVIAGEPLMNNPAFVHLV